MLAALFGAFNDMDAIVVAFRIRILIRDLFAEGAMSAAFVPTFTRQLTLHGKDDAGRLGNTVLNALLVTIGLLVAGGIVFAGPLIGAYAGDFARVPGKLALTVQLTRVLLPFGAIGFEGLALGTSIAAIINAASSSGCCDAAWAGSTAAGYRSRSSR